MADLIREYALCCLRRDGGEADLRRRHAEFFLGLAERANAGIKTTERVSHLGRLDEERDNLRAALEWSCSESGDRELSLRLAGALFWYWNLRAEFSEGRSWLKRALGERRAARARALYGAGGMAFLQDDFEAARPLVDESVAIWRSLGPEHERDLGYALTILGMTALGQNHLDFALESATECVEIFRKHKAEDRWGLALALNDLGNVRRRRGEISEALELYKESLALWMDLGDTWGLPLTRSNLGFLLMMDKKFADARCELEEALEIQRSMNDRWGSAETLKYLGDLAVRERSYQEAEAHYLESLQRNQESGRRQFMIGCLAGLAVSSAGKRLTKLAAFLFGAVRSLREECEVSERIFDEEMFQQAWKDLDSELRDSPGFQQEYRDGARRKDPAVRLERAIARVFQELPLPEVVDSARSTRRLGLQPGGAAVGVEDFAGQGRRPS
jgi:tetratricopeptide (TPR) repeat protein